MKTLRNLSFLFLALSSFASPRRALATADWECYQPTPTDFQGHSCNTARTKVASTTRSLTRLTTA